MIYFCGQDMSAMKHARQREAARALLLFALGREYGLTRLPKIEEDDRGKPFFSERPDIRFNYSHCRAGILVGIGNAEIGVDAETVREFKESLTARVCHPREIAALGAGTDRNAALTKLWTAKEAYLKYTGEGIRRDLRELDMSAVLNEGRLRAEDACLCLWERGDVCLCACSREPELLRLHTVAPDAV